VFAGEALLAPQVTRRLISAFVGRPGQPSFDPALPAALTDRERQLVTLVAEGLSNQSFRISRKHGWRWGILSSHRRRDTGWRLRLVCR
jgi:hypothetical protein